MIILVFIGVLMLLVCGIVAVVFTVGKNQKQLQKKSIEAEKIENMLKDGKITPAEAAELKKAVGLREFSSGMVIVDKHIKILSTLEIINALLISPCLLALFCLSLFFGSISLAQTSLENSMGIGIFGLLIGLFALCLLVAIVIRFWAAVKLKSGSKTAKIIILILSVIDLTSFPLGTALGIYAFYVLLFREGAEEYYKSLTLNGGKDASSSAP